MPATERQFDRASRRAARLRAQIGEEMRIARLTAGISQAGVARAARLSQPVISRIEAGSFSAVSIDQICLVANAVGLDLSVRAYPGRQPTRDAGHARKLTAFLQYVVTPLRYGLEVGLPQREGVPEQRAWDAMIFGPEGDIGVELEMRLYDLQAQTRRIFLKWHDSGADRLLLLINDTQANRRVLREFPDYFTDLTRLKATRVVAQLTAGERPPTGYLLI